MADHDERFGLLRNPRSGFWEVRERRMGRSYLRARRLTRQGAELAMEALWAQVRGQEAGHSPASRRRKES